MQILILLANFCIVFGSFKKRKREAPEPSPQQKKPLVLRSVPNRITDSYPSAPQAVNILAFTENCEEAAEMLTTWLPFIHLVTRLDIGIFREEINTVLTQAKQDAAAKNTPFPIIFMRNGLLGNDRYLDSWDKAKRYFANNLADSIQELGISESIAINKRVSFAKKIISKADRIEILAPETDDVRQIMLHANPASLLLNGDTELDLSIYNRLNNVELKVPRNEQKLVIPSVLPNILDNSSVRHITITFDENHETVDTTIITEILRNLFTNREIRKQKNPTKSFPLWIQAVQSNKKSQF
jgi:hypothetical protein